MDSIEHVSLWCAAAIHDLGQRVASKVAKADVATTGGGGGQLHPHTGQRPAHQPHDRPRATGVDGGAAFDDGAQGGNVLR